MTDADTIRAFLANVVPGMTDPDVGDAAAALDRLLARVEQAERERDNAIAVAMKHQTCFAERFALGRRAEQAERERDTLRAALERIEALGGVYLDEYCEIARAALAAVSPPQEGGDGLYIDHSLAVVKFPSPPQEGEAGSAARSDRPTVTVCYCGGGDVHEWMPHGGGMRILACPPEPSQKPKRKRPS